MCPFAYFSGMNKKKKTKPFQNVKLSVETVNFLRENKKVTGIPITTYVEQAIKEKRNRK